VINRIRLEKKVELSYKTTYIEKNTKSFKINDNMSIICIGYSKQILKLRTDLKVPKIYEILNKIKHCLKRYSTSLTLTRPLLVLDAKILVIKPLTSFLAHQNIHETLLFVQN